MWYSQYMYPEKTPITSAVNIDLQIGQQRVLRTISNDGQDPQPKARVVLLRPPLMFAEGAVGNEIVPSIGLAYLNGYLRKFGYEPDLVDGQGDGHNKVTSLDRYPGYQIQGLTFEEIFAHIPPLVDVFGVSAMFSAEWPLARDFIVELRQRYPQALIVAGGEHITAATDFSLRDCPALDYAVRGEGEHVFLEICECVTRGYPVTAVPGVAWLEADGRYVESSGVTRIRNIDTIPWPHWPEGYLEKFWQSGKSFGVRTARDMPLMTTRGCPYQCTFCSNKDMWTTRYVMRDIDDIVNEVKFYYEKYRVTSFQIYDLTAITKRKWFLALLDKLLEINLPVEWSFPSGTRSEILDGELLAKLKQVGTSYLCYAPESGSEQTLHDIKKRIHLDSVLVSINEATRLGLKTRANFIIGFPEERRRDIYRTFWIALRCVAKGVEDLQPYLFNPYPGSALFTEAVARGDIALGDPYFLSISKQNSDIFSFSPVTFNRHIPRAELAVYRLVMTLSCYALGYLMYPSRIVRSIRNIVGGKRADTVLEARLSGLLTRKKQSRQPRAMI